LSHDPQGDRDAVQAVPGLAPDSPGFGDEADDASDADRAGIPIEITDAFDESWFMGRPPVIEEFLTLVPERDRKRLLKELLCIEWDHRKKIGARCEYQDYLTRFPQAANWLARHWRTTFPDEGPGPQPSQKKPGRSDKPAERKSSEARYRIEKRIGRGQFGEVYLALDRTLSRNVALKIIRSEWVLDTDARRRFRREAEVIGRLTHPGIIPVYDYGHFTNGEPFYAMKYVEAVGSLASRIRHAYRTEKPDEPDSEFSHAESPKTVSQKPPADVSGSEAAMRRPLWRRLRSRHDRTAGTPIPPDALETRYLLEKFLAMIAAVAYAHENGIIHRDIKPEHLILGSYGESFLVDWGMALVADQKPDADSDEIESAFGSFSESAFENLSKSPGKFAGTPEYCSPEQALGLPCNRACDIYSLGATLYHIMTGRPPRVVGPNRPCLIEAARRNDFDPPRQALPSLDKAIEQVILKAMHSKPQRRYASALELGDDVRRWMAGEPVLAWKEPWTRRAWRFVRHHRRAATIGGLATFVVLAFLAWFSK